MTRRRVTAALALAVTWATAAPALAQPRGWRGGVTLSLESGYHRITAAGADDARAAMAAIGASVRALAGKWWLLYGLGFDYRLGATSPRGLLFEADLYPIGLGLLLGKQARIAATAGVGFGGALDRVPWSARFPVEASIELDLVGRVRAAGFARAIWVTDDRREQGSASVDWTDEIAAGLTLRWGRRYYPGDPTLSGGNGYFAGVVYQEQLGSTIVGGVFGYSLDASMGRF